MTTHNALTSRIRTEQLKSSVQLREKEINILCAALKTILVKAALLRKNALPEGVKWHKVIAKRFPGQISVLSSKDRLQLEVETLRWLSCRVPPKQLTWSIKKQDNGTLMIPDALVEDFTAWFDGKLESGDPAFENCKNSLENVRSPPKTFEEEEIMAEGICEPVGVTVSR